MSNIRVRIAPSPTGNLHIGTARTALFNYLFAKKMGGKFILRIEDTDLARSRKDYEKNIISDLSWLGIDADEGPEQGGKYAPYRQTERFATYEKYTQKLLKNRSVFYCFHSEDELENERVKLQESKLPQVHMCEFRTMDVNAARELAETDPNHIIRFKTPAGKKISFTDIIRGELSFETDLIGDFSIAKHVDTPLYNFAVVVDDEEMKITHVIRGEDHISNTPKQMLLIEALGFRVPEYAHLPLILGEDRAKMSKREGATSIDEYRAEGYLPEALINFLVLLGWHPEDADAKEILPEKKIIEAFSLERVQKGGAVFDHKKLDWMNGEYIRKKTVDELVKLCTPFLERAGVDLDGYDNEYIKKIVALEQSRLVRLSEIGEKTDYFFQRQEYNFALLSWKLMTKLDIFRSLETSQKIITELPDNFTEKDASIAFLKHIGTADKGTLLWPLRVALTGKKASPGPFEVSSILGKEESLERIEIAKKKL